MPTYQVTGGVPLFGSVRIGGAKNASFKLMIAALLGKSPSRLLNFSHISDVAAVAKIIRELGAKAEVVGERAYMIDPAKISQHVISSEYGEGTRASTLFLPALLHHFGEAEVPFPGGDKIGSRPLDRHFEGLEALGVKLSNHGKSIHASARELKGTTYRFRKNTHTGTETLIMAAVLATGRTVLENAAEETEIDDLITFLNEMGAKIRRRPGRVIEVEGVAALHGAVHKIMPDQNQAVSYACAALATGGDIIVEDAIATDLQAFLEKLDEVGARYEIGKYGIRFFVDQPLVSTDVMTAIHPGFKTDWQPLWVTMMTQAKGVSTLHETISQSRFAYVESLRQMGAQIELFQPVVSDPDAVYNFNIEEDIPGTEHAARITGPTALQAGEFEVKDLRHGATLIIAGLIAQGTTVLHDPANHIDRGYEQLAARLQALGAQITRRGDE